MCSEINEKIEQAQQGMARLHKINSMIEQLESEREGLNRKKDKLKIIMEKENCDVEKLESKSIAAVFYSVLGNLDERVEKERKEALAAKLKYGQVAKDLDDVIYQISKLNSERLHYVDCQKNYDSLYARKREELIKEKGEPAQNILQLEERLNRAKINRIEIKEAISIGKDVLHSLDCAIDSLDSAEGWGTWDLLGGGIISDLAKHSHIDDAKAATENTQILLRQFKTELTDIRIDSDIMIETDGFARFADFFFDGLIADWFMQSKIHESQESVSKVKSQVLNIMEQLRQLENQENSDIERFGSEMDALIIKA